MKQAEPSSKRGGTALISASKEEYGSVNGPESTKQLELPSNAVSNPIVIAAVKALATEVNNSLVICPGKSKAEFIKLSSETLTKREYLVPCSTRSVLIAGGAESVDVLVSLYVPGAAPAPTIGRTNGTVSVELMIVAPA
jgi:hypothetical protein